jgi:hypothetical protein
MILPEHDDLPIVCASQRVRISLPEEADAICVYQSIDIGRKMMKASVIELDSTDILFTAAPRLDLVIPPNIVTNPGNRDRQRNH